MSQTFLVESYGSELTSTAVRALAVRVSAAARQLQAQGCCVTLLGWLLVPADEVCFWRFSGPSIAAVEAVSELAGLHAQRIARSVETIGDGTGEW